MKNVYEWGSKGRSTEKINLSLKEGEITALVSASSSSKSTLLTIATGLQPPSDEKVAAIFLSALIFCCENNRWPY